MTRIVCIAMVVGSLPYSTFFNNWNMGHSVLKILQMWPGVLFLLVWNYTISRLTYWNIHCAANQTCIDTCVNWIFTDDTLTTYFSWYLNRCITTLFENKQLTESLACLPSSSSLLAPESTTSFSKHAEPKDELFWWDSTKWHTASLGLPCPGSCSLRGDSPSAVTSGDTASPDALQGSGLPQRDLSPSKRAGVEQLRLGCDDENTRSKTCFFFRLNIHKPDSFLPSPLRLSEPSFGLRKGFGKFFHIFLWEDDAASCSLAVSSLDFSSIVPEQQPASLLSVQYSDCRCGLAIVRTLIDSRSQLRSRRRVRPFDCSHLTQPQKFWFHFMHMHSVAVVM